MDKTKLNAVSYSIFILQIVAIGWGKQVISVLCDFERQLDVFWKMSAFRGESSASVRAL